MSLDDGLFSEFGKALWALEELGPGLDDLLVPRQASSGENAGKPPARRGSRPPIDVVVLDVKLEVLATLGFWCGQVVSAGCGPAAPPHDRGVVGLACWLRARLPEIEEFEWAEMAAHEVIGQARRVEDLVAPPLGADDPAPIEWGTSREVASWSRNLGCDVGRETVRRWAAQGRVASRGDGDGRVLISLPDVLKCAGKASWLGSGPPAC